MNKRAVLRRIAYALWLLACGLLWFFENGAATAALGLASILLPGASIAIACIGRRHVLLSLQAGERCEKRVPLPVTLTVRSRLALCVLCGELVTKNALTGEEHRLPLCLGLRPGTQTMAVTLQSDFCGLLTITPRLFVSDLFGLLCGRPLPTDACAVTVQPALFLPNVVLSESASQPADSERYSTTQAGSDPSETFQVRPYVPGDPIRQIHWKLSGKTGQVMLRELGLPIVDETLLLFSPSADSTPALRDTMAEALLSLSHALLLRETPHTAAFRLDGTTRLQAIGTQADWRLLCDLLLGTTPDGGDLIAAPGGTCYAHTVLVCDRIPAGIDLLPHGGCVSVLLAGSEAASCSAYTVYHFSPAAMRQDLQTFII